MVFSSSSDNKPKSEVTWGATAGALISCSGRRPSFYSWVLRAWGAQAAGREVAVDQQVTPDDAWSKP